MFRACQPISETNVNDFKHTSLDSFQLGLFSLELGIYLTAAGWYRCRWGVVRRDCKDSGASHSSRRGWEVDTEVVSRRGSFGSGDMFVQSEKFVKAHGRKVKDFSTQGQESNQTTCPKYGERNGGL